MRRAAAVVVGIAGLLLAGAPARAQEPAQPPAAVPAQWRFVDTQLRAMDRLWVARRGFYDRSSLALQALMLQVHAETLAVGAPAAVRRDGRIAPLIRRILRPGTLRRRRARAAQRTVHVPHVPGFYEGGRQHFSFDAPIVLALARAWQVRGPAQLPRDLAARARAAVLGIARSRFYRWPSLRLGQVNWWTDVQAAASMVGRRDILRRDYPRQLNRLARARRRNLKGALSPQFNQGLGWRYEPLEAAMGTKNRTDSSEYGSLAISALRHERRARAAGMAPLPRSTRRFLKTWSCRVLAGDWTHDSSGAYLSARLRPGRLRRGYIALPTAMGATLQRDGRSGWQARNVHGRWRLRWTRRPRGTVRLVHRGRGRHDLVFALRRGRVTRIGFRLDIG